MTDLIFTHLHFDHIGWASAGGTAFFSECNHALRSSGPGPFPPRHARGRPTCRRYTGRSRWLSDSVPFSTESKHGSLMARSCLASTCAWRPATLLGSSVMVISDRTERALILGDIVHCPLELMDDDFNLLVDYDQAWQML